MNHKILTNDMKAAVKCKFILYADDSALLVSGKDVVKIEQVLSRELKAVNLFFLGQKRVYKKMISYISHAMVRTLK